MYICKKMEQYRVSKVCVDDTHIWVETTNGWKAGYPFSQWHQLAHASQEQRQKFFLSRYGIHWPELDEDLNFYGMFADAGFCKHGINDDVVYYQA